MAQRAVLMKTGLKSFNTARPVNTVRSVNTGRPFSTARLEFCDKNNMAAFLEKSTGSEGFHQVIDFLSQSHISYALTKKAQKSISFLSNNFWRTADDASNWTLMGRVTIMPILIANPPRISLSLLKKTILTVKIMMQHEETYQRIYKGHCMVFPTMLTLPTPESLPTPSSSPSRITSSHSLSSEPSTEPIFEPQPSPDAEYHVPSPNESPLHDVHSYGSDEGSLKLNEFTNLVTKLSERIGVLEDDLKKTKQTYSSAFTKLILKIKKLESKVKTRKARKRARIVLSEDEEDDSSKQGRIDEDLNTYFAQDDEVVHDQDTAKEGHPEDSTAGITVSTAPINNSTARETHSTAGRVVYGRRSKEARKDKGKAIITEPEPEKKSKKLLEQERLGLEEAIRLQKQVDEEEKA
ncbi:hypothetical protein Tco_0620044 [Tanacetum coccineum]